MLNLRKIIQAAGCPKSKALTSIVNHFLD